MAAVSAALLRAWASASRFDSVCRLCLREDERCSSLSRPLYVRAAGFRGTLAVREILNRTLQTKNYNEDSFPQNICDACLETTLHFFTFWQHCLHTEEQLISKLAILSKLVSKMHTEVFQDKSQYSNQNTGIVFLNSKTIEYLDPDISKTNKRDATYTYLNRNVPYGLQINNTERKLKKAKVIKTIKDYVPLNSVLPRNTSSLNFYCSYCPESFTQNSELTCHLKLHHHILDVAECTECGKKFKTIQLLKQHAISHKGTQSKCTICKANFETPVSLEAHINEKHTEFKFKCPDCHELFQKERDISIHQWNTHKVGYEYYCKVCGKKFRNFYAVKSHEEQHEGFDCDHCGQKFNTKLKLKSHLVSCLREFENPDDIMCDVEKYTCDYCKKNFYRKATLRQHILNLHMYPKRYRCPNCEKRVSTKTQLEAHMVVHTRERSEQCNVCGKYFVTKYALTYHMRLHTGERPYACEMCDERFLSASRRMAHVKRKHIGRTEQCNVCSKSYYSGYALRRHMQRHFDPSSSLYENNVCS